MVDNRSAGFFGVGGAFNFKSGNISGTAANLSDDKMGQGGEYANLRGEQEEEKTHSYPYMDRSAVLRATLNSLAMMNVADVINNKRPGVDASRPAEETQRVEAIREELQRRHKQDEQDGQTEHNEYTETHDTEDTADDEDFDFAGELD